MDKECNVTRGQHGFLDAQSLGLAETQSAIRRPVRITLLSLSSIPFSSFFFFASLFQLHVLSFFLLLAYSFFALAAYFRACRVRATPGIPSSMTGLTLTSVRSHSMHSSGSRPGSSHRHSNGSSAANLERSLAGLRLHSESPPSGES